MDQQQHRHTVNNITRYKKPPRCPFNRLLGGQITNPGLPRAAPGQQWRHDANKIKTWLKMCCKRIMVFRWRDEAHKERERRCGLFVRSLFITMMEGRALVAADYNNPTWIRNKSSATMRDGAFSQTQTFKVRINQEVGNLLSFSPLFLSLSLSLRCCCDARMCPHAINVASLHWSDCDDPQIK